MQDPRTQTLRIIANNVDREVARGRSLEDVLDDFRKQQPRDAWWYDRSSLRTLSGAVAVSFANEPRVRLDHMLESTFDLCGKTIDSEVLEGLSVEDALAKWTQIHGGKTWYDPQMLHHYSIAVAALWKRRSETIPSHRSDLKYDPMYLPG